MCLCVRLCVSHPWSRGCFRVTLLPPGGPQALQKVLVGGVGGVKDGEAQDGGGVMEEQGVQLEEREVLQGEDTQAMSQFEVSMRKMGCARANLSSFEPSVSWFCHHRKYTKSTIDAYSKSAKNEHAS